MAPGSPSGSGQGWRIVSVALGTGVLTFLITFLQAGQPVVVSGLIAAGGAIGALGVVWALLESLWRRGLATVAVGAAIVAASLVIPALYDPGSSSDWSPVPPTLVASGQAHTCAVSGSKGLLCWGWNHVGQLGIGTKDDATRPVAVSLPEGVKSVVSGNEFTCALLNSRGVWCWGENLEGQLGTGMAGRELRSDHPQAVQGLSMGIASLAAGYSHACAVTSAGGLFCWGANNAGQVGNGTRTDTSEPTAVTGLSSGVRQVAAGVNHTCALLIDNRVQCWGDLDSEGEASGYTSPRTIGGLPGQPVGIAAGRYGTCVLSADATVYCWGWNPADPLLRAGQSQTPSPISGLSGNVQRIAIGDGAACAILTDRTVRCWGSNENGELGDGTTTQRVFPTVVVGLQNVVDIAPGTGHTCALTADSSVYCWGSNSSGQLGAAVGSESLRPVKVTTP
ncbi:chromosome condensation regulator RCC1 [Nakamurella silvestris]|nr:chromosome condensation regulator RCC1 [Nakamurella silvestris]